MEPGQKNICVGATCDSNYFWTQCSIASFGGGHFTHHVILSLPCFLSKYIYDNKKIDSINSEFKNCIQSFQVSKPT